MELNWPAVTLILGLVALGLFRVPLSRLLERTEKIKDWLVAPKQQSALPAPTDQPLPTRNAIEDQRGYEELTKGFDNQLLVLQEQSIRADLTKHKLIAETASEKALVRHLAGTQILLAFETLYHQMYHSQIEALRWLNGQQVGVLSQALMPFYQKGVSDWPMIYQNYSFHAWLAWLGSRGLVTESAESAKTPADAEPFGIEITVMGRAFLGWLVNAGRPDPLLG